MTTIFTLRDSKPSPLTSPAVDQDLSARLTSLLPIAAFSVCSNRGLSGPLPPTGNIQQAFQILLQMPRHYCCSCRAPLHTTDGLGECVSCLGECHAKTALTESPCSHSKNMSLASLRSQIAFFIRGKDEPVRLLLSSLWQ